MAEVLIVDQDMLQSFQSLLSSARHVAVLTGVWVFVVSEFKLLPGLTACLHDAC